MLFHTIDTWGDVYLGILTHAHAARTKKNVFVKLTFFF